MCGIGAIFDADTKVSLEELEILAAAMGHRGPDGFGNYISLDCCLGLSHTRLAINDIAGGEQPIANESYSVFATVNGELYDYDETRSSLESAGHHFRTMSDSELVVHMYEEYGESCYERFRGEFSFLLWDASLNRLIGCRDRSGVKPLYYSLYGKRLIAASELKALHALKGACEWDSECVNELIFNWQVHCADISIFSGLSQVPPGHYFSFDGATFSISRYVRSPFLPVRQRRLPFSAACDEFRKLFMQAVHRRLKSDVPVGCYLSSGIDSSAVAAIACKAVDKPMRAFTLHFENDQYSELKATQEYAKRHSLELEDVLLCESVVSDNFEKAVCHSGTPISDQHAIAKFILSKYVSESGIKVVLTGEGADEVLAGYPGFYFDQSAKSGGSSNGALEEARFQYPHSAGLNLPVARTHSRSQLLVDVLGSSPTWLQAHSNICEILINLRPSNYQIKRTDIGSTLLSVRAHLGRQTLSSLRLSMFAYSETNLPNYILSVLGDRMEMAHGVEGRTPFLDEDLLLFVGSLSDHNLIRHGVQKALLREALSSTVGNESAYRLKTQFRGPALRPMSKGPLWSRLMQIIADHEFHLTPFLDEARTKKYMNTLAKKTVLEGPECAAIYTIASLFCLAKFYIT